MTRLMTASLGPEDRGRGYGVLRHTLDAATMARYGALLGDFSLALAAWADLAAPPFAAMFPLDEEGSAYALCRASYLGRAELGTVAVANVVILPDTVVSALERRAHKLLAVVPAADGSPFGHERLDLSTAPLRPKVAAHAPMKAFGLEWRDHVLELSEADPEQTLGDALESISPSVQRARVRGWSTTSALAVSGGFNPGAAFQLALHETGQPIGAALMGHRFATVRAGQVVDAPDQEPDTWRAWTVIRTVTDRFHAVPKANWRPQDQAAPVAHVVALALLQAALPLEPKQRVDLLAQVVSRQTTPADLRPGILEGAGEALARIIRSTEPLKAGAYYLEATLAALGAGEADAAAALVSSAPLAETLEGLSNEGRQAMVQADGLAALLASEHDWTAATTSSIRALIEACSHRMAVDQAARRLSAPLVSELSVRGNSARAAAVKGLSARLSARPGADDVELANPRLAALTSDLPANERQAYFGRALFPILRGDASVSRAAFLDGLKAAVNLV